MIEIPAGKFLMGLNQHQTDLWTSQSALIPRYNTLNRADTAPQMRIDLPRFDIDQVEVTNRHYRLCVQANVCEPSLARLESANDYADNVLYNDYPVYVNWFQAQTYCQWVVKRLPTEAEWEKAARGTDGRLYAWGNEWDAQKGALELRRPKPVGSYPSGASPYGVLDMTGNAEEWTGDWFTPYPQRNVLYNWPANEGVPDVPLRTVRDSGQFQYDAYVPIRIGLDPQHQFVGFRCVRGPASPPDWRAAAIILDNIPTPVPTLIPTATPDLSEMVYIPAGWFVMGTDNSTDDPKSENQNPAHTVYLNTYHIDRHEVTLAEYAEFLNALPTPLRACEGYDCSAPMNFDPVAKKYGPYEGQRGTWPAAGVTWFSSDAYCRWRGKRLPTEAEWEKAARGTDGRNYPWGNDERQDIFEKMSGPYGGLILYDIQAVPDDLSPYGVWDMLGGVPEWVSDWYDPNYYAHSPAYNPSGPSTGIYRTTRSHTGNNARRGLTWRTPDSPYMSDLHEGFRCAYSSDATS